MGNTLSMGLAHWCLLSPNSICSFIFVRDLQLQTQYEPVKRLASVVSFFISCIDAPLDPLLEKLNARGGNSGGVQFALLCEPCHGDHAMS
jgi:hypothetical protein